MVHWTHQPTFNYSNVSLCSIDSQTMHVNSWCHLSPFSSSGDVCKPFGPHLSSLSYSQLWLACHSCGYSWGMASHLQVDALRLAKYWSWRRSNPLPVTFCHISWYTSECLVSLQSFLLNVFYYIRLHVCATRIKNLMMLLPVRWFITPLLALSWLHTQKFSLSWRDLCCLATMDSLFWR